MPVKKLGWILSGIGPNQIYYDCVKASNDYLAEYDDVDISLYWVMDGPRMAIQPRFACMCLFEAYAFPGTTIATNLHTLSRVLDYPGPNRQKYILFYDYGLDYMRIPHQMKQFEQLNGLYNHHKVKVIARSEDHANIIHSTFTHSRPAVIENCNIKKFKELL